MYGQIHQWLILCYLRGTANEERMQMYITLKRNVVKVYIYIYIVYKKQKYSLIVQLQWLKEGYFLPCLVHVVCIFVVICHYTIIPESYDLLIYCSSHFHREKIWNWFWWVPLSMLRNSLSSLTEPRFCIFQDSPTQLKNFTWKMSLIWPGRKDEEL